MNIVYLDAYPLGNDIDISPLLDLENVEIYERTPKELVLQRAKDATILLTNKCPLTKEVLTQLPKLKYIGVTATGYNIVDTKAAKELGIIVTNASDYSTNSVAQHVFSMILQLTNQTHTYSDKGKWVSSPDFCYFNSSINELANKTLGVIGFGNIGKKVVQIGEAFGMKCIINKRNLIADDQRMVALETLITTSDYISLHLPLTIDNQQFVDNSFINKMKQGAVLINTSRGGLINETELAEALNNNRIKAALDVLSTEPPTNENPLLKAANCIITPHIAWGSFEARKKLLEIVVENIIAFQNGKPQNVVN